MPGEHRNRRRNFSSTELANALLVAAEELRADFPEATTYIGDISGARGGPISGHSSHEIGLDVDLAFFYRDAQGKLVPPTFMWHVGPDGVSTTDAPETLTFDADLTWAFLERLLRSSQIELQWAFVSAPVEAKLLEAGRRAQAPEELLRRAETILHQLTRGAPHDDHLHLRAYCPPSDWEFCVDTGPVWDWVVQPPPPRPENAPLVQR
jgi:penicillin-insensitive murein endopeptidase